MPLDAFRIRQATQLRQVHRVAVLIEDANVWSSGRDKAHNAFGRRLGVGALVHDLTNASAGRDNEVHGATVAQPGPGRPSPGRLGRDIALRREKVAQSGFYVHKQEAGRAKIRTI